MYGKFLMKYFLEGGMGVVNQYPDPCALVISRTWIYSFRVM
jgi:hypothetical protein